MSHRKKAIPSSTEFPMTLERGATGRKGTAKIYLSPVKIDGESYQSFTVVYYYLRKRRRERFNIYEKAYAYAEEKALQLGNDEIDALSLTGRDRRIYTTAMEALRPLEISLDLAAREYLSARKVLGDVPLMEAVAFYDRHGRSVTKKGTLQEILTAMLQALKQDGRSQYHVRDIRRHVTTFIGNFDCAIEDISTTQINEWLRGLEVKGRTRDNYRDSIHNFFGFARSEGFLPQDRATAVAGTKRVSEAGADNEIFSVEEITRLLRGAPEHLIPVLAVKAFSGIRTEEMVRIEWQDIKFDQDVIFLQKKVTKTKQRRIVPLLPNLKSWLQPYQKANGRIADNWASAHSLCKAWTRLAKNVNVVYKRNAMRNSYISYRVADLKNVAQVALESGNSPSVIQKDYLELVTESEAKKWFNIFPS